MRINIICVGKLKEKYWKEACEEYLKRLKSYADLKIIELAEEKEKGAGEAEESRIKSEEGKRILSAIPQGSYVITLEIKGKALSSEGLAEKIESLGIEGKSDISFIIGGSLGMSEEVMARSDFALSFSNMTFPHQMMRVILLEQIYRSYKIIRKETYHK